MIIVLDSNVLLRVVNRDDPQHNLIRNALRFLHRRGDAFCFFPQHAAEFWSVCTRPHSARGGLGVSADEADRRLRLLHRMFDVYPEVPGAYSQWHSLVAEMKVMGAQVHDTRIVALMLAHGLTHILTYDTADFKRYSDITVLSPKDFS